MHIRTCIYKKPYKLITKSSSNQSGSTVHSLQFLPKKILWEAEIDAPAISALTVAFENNI